MIIGHQNILEYLKKSVEKNAVSHAYLFSGPKSVGKSAVALEFAKTLLCQNTAAKGTLSVPKGALSAPKAGWFCGECDSCSAAGNNSHPDILIVKPDEGGVIAISKIRDLRSRLNLSPYLGVYQAAIIEEAEKMNKEAANTLLKTLEEPRGDKIIILTSSEPKNILPTILSRVYGVKFNLVPADLIEKEIVSLCEISRREIKIRPDIGRFSEEKKKEISRLCDGRPGLALSYVFDEEKMRNRQKRLEEFLKLISADNNERLRYAEVLVKGMLTVPKGEENIGEILGYWTDFFRDLMFFHFNFPEKIKYAGFSPYGRSPEGGQKELAVLSQKYPVEKASRLMRLISDVDFMVSRTNTNPQLALEVLVLAL